MLLFITKNKETDYFLPYPMISKNMVHNTNDKEITKSLKKFEIACGITQQIAVFKLRE